MAKKLDHKKMLKDIRPFVSFNFNLNRKLTTAQKSKITRYHSILYGKLDSVKETGGKNFSQGLLNRSHILYRPRNPTRKKKALEIANAKGFPDLKAIPILSPAHEKQRVHFDRFGNLTLKGATVDKVFELFNKKSLIKNPEKEVNRITNKYPSVKSWRIQNGKNEISPGVERESIASEVILLMNTYDNFDKWLDGLVGNTFNNQMKFNDYLNQLEDSRESAHIKTKRVRRRKTKRERIKGRK